jgi:hypothetical protein
VGEVADEVGVEPERLAELASALENLRDVLTHNVPVIVNTMERYWNDGTGTPVNLNPLKQAQARSPEDAADMRARSDLAQAWMNNSANIDVVSSGMAYIPWDSADVDKADAQLAAQQFAAAERSGNRAQINAIRLDVIDHSTDKEWLAYFWSQPGTAGAAGNLAAMLAREDDNHLTASDQKLLTTYATSLAAAYNLGGLSTTQKNQLADGLAAAAAKDPGPVALLLQSAPDASDTMNALATAIEDQDLKHYWEPGRLIPNLANLIPDSAGHLTSDEEGALYFGTAGYLFSKYGTGYRVMLPGSSTTPWPNVPRMDRLAVEDEVSALGRQWVARDSGLLVTPGTAGVDPRMPLPPDDLGAGWKTGVNSGLRYDPVNVPKWADYSSKGLAAVGVGLTLYSQWDQTWQDDEALHPTWSTGERVADAAGQTAVIGGTTAGGALAGAELGAEAGASIGVAAGTAVPVIGNVVPASSEDWSAAWWAASRAARSAGQSARPSGMAGKPGFT